MFETKSEFPRPKETKSIKNIIIKIKIDGHQQTYFLIQHKPKEL